MRKALARRDLQTVLRLYRKCTGLTQEAIGLLLDRDQGTVSKIISGRRSRFSIEDVEAFRDGLHIPGHLLGLQPGEHEMAAAVTVETPTREGDEDVKRRSFNKAVLLAAIGVPAGPLGEALAAPEPPKHIGWEHIRMLQQAIQRLETQDALVGGDALCDTAAWLYRRASGWLQKSSYSPEVGDALQAAIGELGSWAGWLAFDADQYDKARAYYQETLLLARTTDDHPLEVGVLSSMCLLSLRQQRPREALQMATAAQRIAAGWGTPRLMTLLHLRAASAYANMANPTGFQRETTKARRWFDAGPHPDDLLFIRFVTEQEVTGLIALSHMALGQSARAAQMLQPIVDSPDPDRARNTSYYTVRLAEAHLQAGDFAEAAAVGTSAIQAVSAVSSRRTRRHLRQLRDQAAQHADAAAPIREFIEQYDTTFTRQVAPRGI